ncbi:hypothetical protein C0J52_06163 [Blattella germanica]|nr:hypothetical protein C0J52_06163 [Blattella germanica]
MWLQSTICPACFHKHGCEDRTRRKDGMDRQHIVVHVWLQSRSDHDSDGIQTCWRFFHHEWNLRESAITDQHGNHYCSGKILLLTS